MPSRRLQSAQDSLLQSPPDSPSAQGSGCDLERGGWGRTLRSYRTLPDENVTSCRAFTQPMASAKSPMSLVEPKMRAKPSTPKMKMRRLKKVMTPIIFAKASLARSS